MCLAMSTDWWRTFSARFNPVDVVESNKVARTKKGVQDILQKNLSVIKIRETTGGTTFRW